MVKKNLSLVECHVVNCRDVEDLVGSYVDQEIDVELKQRVDEHLDDCEGCRLLVTDLCNIISCAKTLNDKPVPADVSRRLRATLSEKLGIELSSPKPQLALIKSSVLKTD